MASRTRHAEQQPDVEVAAAREQLAPAAASSRRCRRAPSASRSPGRRRAARRAAGGAARAGGSRRRPSRRSRRSPASSATWKPCLYAAPEAALLGAVQHLRPAGRPRPARRRSCRCRRASCRRRRARATSGWAARSRPDDPGQVVGLVVGRDDHHDPARGRLRRALMRAPSARQAVDVAVIGVLSARRTRADHGAGSRGSDDTGPRPSSRPSDHQPDTAAPEPRPDPDRGGHRVVQPDPASTYDLVRGRRVEVTTEPSGAITPGEAVDGRHHDVAVRSRSRAAG